MKLKVKDMTFIALFAALMCVISPFSLPIGPVPISLATLVVYIVASFLDYKRAPVVVLVYILIGICGLPVFSSFSGGIGKIIEPTGGYIIGYFFLAIIESILITIFRKKKWVYPLAMIAGTLVLYIFGTAWFMVLTEYSFTKAMMACVIPFLPGDALKIIIATSLSITLREKYDHFVYVGNTNAQIEEEEDSDSEDNLEDSK